MMSLVRPLCSAWQGLHSLAATLLDVREPDLSAIFFAIGAWSWHSRHFLFDSSFESLMWQSAQWSLLSSDAWPFDSGPGELPKKSFSATAIPAVVMTTAIASRARFIVKTLPGRKGPRNPDVNDCETGEEHGERNVDLLPRV